MLDDDGVVAGMRSTGFSVQLCVLVAIPADPPVHGLPPHLEPLGHLGYRHATGSPSPDSSDTGAAALLTHRRRAGRNLGDDLVIAGLRHHVRPMWTVAVTSACWKRRRSRAGIGLLGVKGSQVHLSGVPNCHSGPASGG